MKTVRNSRKVIAIASGKGGTGKTLLATNLAAMAARRGHQVQLLDCDVEAPNANLFLGAEIDAGENVCVSLPVIDETRCTHCGECGRFCQFNALACLPKQVLVFRELCHACGGCAMICPAKAITETTRAVGVIERGQVASLPIVTGRLNIGESLAPSVIRQVKRHAAPEGLVLIDAPPGTACPMVESVRDADQVILVTEPTPFGLNDLSLAVETVRALQRPFAVVVNRATETREMIREYCRAEHIPILAEIPDERRIAEAYSRGQLVVEAIPAIEPLFESLLEQLVTHQSRVGQKT